MTLRALWLRLRAIFRPGVVERELDDEIRFHIEHEAAQLAAAGVDPNEALRRARLVFGGVEQTKEAYRDGRGDRLLADLRADVRHGVRILGRQRTLTASVVLILALAIGANVAIFSVVNAVLLRPLPFADPERLVALWEDNALKGWERQTAAPANMLDWGDQVPAFEGIAGWADFGENATLTGAGDAVSVRTTLVTGNFFSVLGVQPMLGRVFHDAETWEQPQRVTVLSHRLWEERFNGDRTIVGRTITLDGNDVEVVGVMGAGFAFPDRAAKLWLPMRWNVTDRGEVWFRRAHWVRPVARLHPGTSVNEARVQLVTVMRSLESRYPETNTAMQAGLEGLQDFLTAGSRKSLLLLLGATAFLLLIACANVGNLLLVRAATREREVVMRRALGAGSGRIARQAFTESTLLALAGGVAGLALGWWGTRILAALQPEGLLPVTDVQPDLRVILFVTLVCFASAALFGTVPALWAARRPPADVFKDGSRTSSAGRRMRVWVGGLAVAELALAVMLTIGSGLLVRSYHALTRVDPGFDPEGVTVTSIFLPLERYDTRARLGVIYDALLENVRALPGVQSAALTTVLPLTSGGMTSDFSIRGGGGDGSGREVRHRRVSPEYFATMKVPVLAGRVFGLEDLVSGEPVIVINETLARRHFGGGDPIGAYITNNLVPDSTSVWRRVIGVVGNEHGAALDQPPGIEITAPIHAAPFNGVHLLVRSAVPPATLQRTIERAIAALDPTLAPWGTGTMEGNRQRALATDRFLAILLSVFAVIGALLAIVGVYGVVAQAALRRAPEMGIRLALGANAGGVQWLIVRHGLVLTLGGVVLGVFGALLLGGVVQTLLFGVSPLDPATFVVVAAGVLFTGALAGWLPARRMARTEVVEVVLRGG